MTLDLETRWQGVVYSFQGENFFFKSLMKSLTSNLDTEYIEQWERPYLYQKLWNSWFKDSGTREGLYDLLIENTLYIGSL